MRKYFIICMVIVGNLCLAQPKYNAAYLRNKDDSFNALFTEMTDTGMSHTRYTDRLTILYRGFDLITLYNVYQHYIPNLLNIRFNSILTCRTTS